MREPGKDLTKMLIERHGGRFSKDIGIDLSGADPGEVFKWFLSARLMGARISTGIAIRTYKEFERMGVVTPEKILETGWNGLVNILDEGGYVRYDFSTATRLIEMAENLKRNYGGDMNMLHERARDSRELERLIKGLGKGIGDVTVNIFLREMRGIWCKARPEPSELVKAAARDLGILKGDEDPLEALERFWSENSVTGWDFRDFEAALLRMGRVGRRKKGSIG